MSLGRLASVRDLVLGRQLMCVLLKLFSFAVNVKVNRQELIRPELNTVNIMLGALNLVGSAFPCFLRSPPHTHTRLWVAVHRFAPDCLDMGMTDVLDVRRVVIIS